MKNVGQKEMVVWVVLKDGIDLKKFDDGNIKYINVFVYLMIM